MWYFVYKDGILTRMKDRKTRRTVLGLEKEEGGKTCISWRCARVGGNGYPVHYHPSLSLSLWEKMYGKVWLGKREQAERTRGEQTSCGCVWVKILWVLNTQRTHLHPTHYSLSISTAAYI